MDRGEAELLGAVGSLCQARGWSAARIVIARSWWRRLVGLIPRSWMSPPAPETVMVFPSCCSVHTFCMGCAIDIVFMDEAGEVVARVDDVPPGAMHTCAGATAVVEHLPARGLSSSARHRQAPPRAVA